MTLDWSFKYVRCIVLNGNNVIASLTQPPYSMQWTNVAAGTYSLTAKATDNLGATTTSAPVSVTVAGSAAQVYDIHTDQLNTPRVITDKNGNAVWRWDSAPFGESLPDENPMHSGEENDFRFNLRFPGQYYDQETGLHYNYFRDYEPTTGRYVQSDPIGLQGGINTYAYVEGDPVSNNDPKGLLAVCRSGMGKTSGKQVGPMYHEFSCYKKVDGSTVCKGFGRDPDSDAFDAIFGSVPGVILNGAENFATAKDSFQDNTCEPDDKNQCMDKCVDSYYTSMEANGAPKYSWTQSGAAQCKEINRRIIGVCKKACHVK